MREREKERAFFGVWNWFIEMKLGVGFKRSQLHNTTKHTATPQSPCSKFDDT